MVTIAQVWRRSITPNLPARQRLRLRWRASSIQRPPLPMVTINSAGSFPAGKSVRVLRAEVADAR